MVEMIGEIGINHNGNIELARRLIAVAAMGGCQYVKFQKRDIDSVYTKEELAALRESPWGTTFREQKAGLEFGRTEYDLIDEFCGHMGIKWFASVWDVKSIEFMESYQKVPFIKIPSALITNPKLMDAAKNSGKPIILSTGMSTFEIVDRAIEMLGYDTDIYCIMHCTSTYPVKNDEINLNCIKAFKSRYPWTKIGYSNHSPGIIFMPVAVALGAEMLEFHITLDRASYGSDQAASIEPEGVMKIGKYAKAVQEALGDGVKKVYDSEIPIMKKLRR